MCSSLSIYETRRYLWGIQRLVSTHQTNSTQSAKICPNLHFQGGRGWWFRPTFLKYLSWGTQGILSTNFAMPYSGSPGIADSLSHTTLVETNNSCTSWNPKRHNMLSTLKLFLFVTSSKLLKPKSGAFCDFFRRYISNWEFKYWFQL